MNNLTISNHYNNDDICSTFLCAPQGGMRRSHKTNTLVLVANHTKSLYEDEWKLDTMNYTGMGSKGDQSLEFAQNKTLAESNENGVSVHFFEVKTKDLLGRDFKSTKNFIVKLEDIANRFLTQVAVHQNK